MKKLLVKSWLVIPVILLISGCTGALSPEKIIVEVENPMNVSRTDEIVGLDWNLLISEMPSLKPGYVLVKDEGSDGELISQCVDNNGDGNVDELIFHSDFEPGAKRSFVVLTTKDSVPAREKKVHAMFVPQRLDDFAWENDRIAFRMYGPALQHTDDPKVKLTSSGIDVWCKKVRYPVLEKWYSPEYGSYHEDKGEGMDFYKVGTTRGGGGTAVWRNGKMHVSENFVDWKILANGPLRLVFELKYAPWQADELRVSETKRVTLDAGSQLNRFDIFLHWEGDAADVEMAAGLPIMLHETGVPTLNPEKGWLSFWEESEQYGDLGTAILMDPQYVSDMIATDDHYLVTTKAKKNEPVRYYAGAGWVPSGDFDNRDEWEDYLDCFAAKLDSRLIVTVRDH